MTFPGVVAGNWVRRKIAGTQTSIQVWHVSIISGGLICYPATHTTSVLFTTTRMRQRHTQEDLVKMRGLRRKKAILHTFWSWIASLHNYTNINSYCFLSSCSLKLHISPNYTTRIINLIVKWKYLACIEIGTKPAGQRLEQQASCGHQWLSTALHLVLCQALWHTPRTAGTQRRESALTFTAHGMFHSY